MEEWTFSTISLWGFSIFDLESEISMPEKPFFSVRKIAIFQGLQLQSWTKYLAKLKVSP
jgi:hypothetical protein